MIFDRWSTVVGVVVNGGAIFGRCLTAEESDGRSEVLGDRWGAGG